MLSKPTKPSLSAQHKVDVVKRSEGSLKAEDGHHKMGAHEAGRVACHASSLEWAVKIGDLHFSLDKNKGNSRCLLLFWNAGVIFTRVRQLFVDIFCFLVFVLNVAVFAENRITPPSPHCLRLWSVLPCWVASRTVFCCRDRLQFTDEARERGEGVL